MYSFFTFQKAAITSVSRDPSEIILIC